MRSFTEALFEYKPHKLRTIEIEMIKIMWEGFLRSMITLFLDDQSF